MEIIKTEVDKILQMRLKQKITFDSREMESSTSFMAINASEWQ